MFGERLKLARKKSGFSLRSLSEALNGEVSAQAIGKYERGEMMPSTSILIQLNRTLDVSIEFLLNDQVEKLEAVEFRKHSGTSVGDRARVEAVVIDHLQRYLAIEEILDLDTGVIQVDQSKNRQLEYENEGEDLAEILRKEWKLGVDPIPNMTSLLEDRGVKVILTRLPNRVSGLTCVVQGANRKEKNMVIVVNKIHTLERRRLTLAHELAHCLISKNSSIDHEKASTIFAGAFLAPKDHLIEEIGKHRKALGYKEIVELKRMYRMSAAALLLRLKQIEVINQSTLSYAFQTFARRWRSSEPEPLEVIDEEGEHEVPRRFERLCYWSLAEGRISLGKASELLQQPLFEIEQGLKGPAGANANNR